MGTIAAPPSRVRDDDRSPIAGLSARRGGWGRCGGCPRIWSRLFAPVVPAATVAAVAVASVAAATDVLVRHWWHACGGWPRNWRGCGGWPRVVGAEAGPRHPWLLHRQMRELPPLPKLSNGCAGVTPRGQRVTLNLLHADGLGEVKGAPADGGWPRIPRRPGWEWPRFVAASLEPQNTNRSNSTTTTTMAEAE